MAVYEYTAEDDSGNKFDGVYNDIDNLAMLRKELAMMNCILVKARRRKEASRRKKKIKQSEVVTFAYKFAGMYSAGLSITTCLETLAEQTENHTFKHVITDIREEIETGSSLEKAFEKYKNIFSEFFLGMLRAGESGGKLATTLEMSAEYLEKHMELRRRIKAAFAYPVTVCVMCLMVICCILLFIIPVFSKLYDQLHVTLPEPTNTLVNISFFIRHWWWAILILLSMVVIGLRKVLKNPDFQMRWSVFKLYMPVFARLNRMVVVSHFTRTFALLVSVGVSLIDALEVANQVAHNPKMAEVSEELERSVKGGLSLGQSLKEYEIFPPMLVQLISSGEQSGRLPEMLNKGADFLDKDIDRVINALIVKLEPTMTFVMGIIIGFLLISIYLPMFDYMTHLK